MQAESFEQNPVNKMSIPGQLDSMLTVTNSRSWLGLTAIGLILAVFMLWVFTGMVNTEVSGEGVLLKPGGIRRVSSPIEGQVRSVSITRGDLVKEGQIAVVLENPRTGEYTLTCSDSGRILEVFVRKGDQLIPGSHLFSLEVGDDCEEKLEAILFVPVEEGQQINPGMDVKISSNVFRKEEYGYMLGQVTAVDDYPSTFEGTMIVLGNEELAKRLMGAGLSIQVKVKLYSAEDTPSGYRWTAGIGPAALVSSGTLCRGVIVIRQERPISLIVPGL